MFLEQNYIGDKINEPLWINHKIRIIRMKIKIVFLVCLYFFLSGCVYQMDIQQGNLLNLENLDRAEVGMTKSQIKYLLGGPVVGTPFKEDRWDYIYYFQPGDNNKTQRYWLIVYFENNRVIKIEKDVITNPG